MLWRPFKAVTCAQIATKAQTLEQLRPLVRESQVPTSVTFDVGRWESDAGAVLDALTAEFGASVVIVRSSSHCEDGEERSNAGVFLSVPDVPAADVGRLRAAIDEVLRSYGTLAPSDEVLVQEMVLDVARSGVVTTFVPDSGAPYYVFAFDAVSGRTDTITSGLGEDTRTVVLLREEPLREEVAAELGGVLSCVREVERLVSRQRLDIEFAVGADGAVYLLQVRALGVLESPAAAAAPQVRSRIVRAFGALPDPNVAAAPLVGHARAWSVMADWNPAEMIGVHPSPLACSLYQHLVTDETWARSRAAVGFRDVRPCRLMYEVLGRPYIDVRASLSSFLPRSIDADLGARLVDSQIAKLRAQPALHDKIEFDVVPTCVGFDFDERATELRRSGFAGSEVSALRAGLGETTGATAAGVGGAIAALHASRIRSDAIAATVSNGLDRALVLLDDARRNGFLAFALLARAAFVATGMLRSLTRVGVLEAHRVEEWLASLETVSGRMQEDGARVARGEWRWGEFVRAYGHLRPGTYDIESPCYAEDAAMYLGPLVRDHMTKPSSDARFTALERNAIERRLRPLAWPSTAMDFELFLRNAIEARELGKFIVSRNVSWALEGLAEWGREHGVTRAELSSSRISELRSLRERSRREARESLGRNDEAAHARRAEHEAVELPPLFFSVDDLMCFERGRCEPNFVTHQRVTAPLCAIGVATEVADVAGKIIAIPAADPGYDWLLSRAPAGLVTMYGGANSHMAVRAREFGLPAALGVGPDLFGSLEGARLVELDCSARRVRAVR